MARMVLAGVVVAGLAGSAIAASAASLGLSSSSLSAWSAPVSVPVPAAVADDPFVTTSCNQALGGTSDSLGNVWLDHGGSWRYHGCDDVRAGLRLPFAHASVDVGVSDDIVVSTNLTRISTQNNRSGPGLTLFADGFGDHIYLIYERDQDRLTLGRHVSGTGTVLAQVDPISDYPSTVLAVEIRQPTLTVLVNGSIALTYDMTAEQALFGSNAMFGLEADNDNWSSFGWFKVETLP